jgi:hypothetical protein
MSDSEKERLRRALENADLELDDDQLDEVAGGACTESCYDQCSACCYNGSANRLAEVAPRLGISTD